MRRVVVTGMGLVTPLGGDVETTWSNIIGFQVRRGQDYPLRCIRMQKCHIACEVKPADHEYGFDPNLRVDHKVQRQVDPFIIYGIDAAGQALEDAGLTDMTDEDKLRAGCSIGSGIGGLAGDREGIDRPVRTRPGPGQPAFCPWPADQSDLRAGFDQIWPDGP